MTTSTRRDLLTATSAAALGGLLLGRRRAAATETPAPEVAAIPAEYPSQDQDVVREMVGASHARIDRVRELLAERPELAKAAYDWGFGDWETALGAASHTGRRDIAELLMEHGARPDVFTAAMLGNLAAVKAFVAASPGIQRRRGPHGITLLAHARAGGEAAASVAAYLEELGDADLKYVDHPLTDAERQALLGVYAFGDGPDERFEVLISSRGLLSLQRAAGVPRTLFHQGNHEFHPAGAPSARFRFTLDGGRATAFEILNPRRILTARRV